MIEKKLAKNEGQRVNRTNIVPKSKEWRPAASRECMRVRITRDELKERKRKERRKGETGLRLGLRAPVGLYLPLRGLYRLRTLRTLRTHQAKLTQGGHYLRFNLISLYSELCPCGPLRTRTESPGGLYLTRFYL